MLGPLDYLIWMVGFLAEIGVVVYLLSRKQAFRYFPIVFYMLCDALVTCGLYYCVHHFGFDSTTYVYFYYYTDSLLNVLMFWVIIKFYQETFAEMGVSNYIRGAAVMLISSDGRVLVRRGASKSDALDESFRCGDRPEFLFRGSGAYVSALGRHIEVARDANAADPIGSGAGDLFQRRCVHVRAAQPFSGPGTESSALVSTFGGSVAAPGMGLHVHTHLRKTLVWSRRD